MPKQIRDNTSAARRDWPEPKLLVSLPESITNMLGGKALFISRVFTLEEKRMAMKEFMDRKCAELRIRY